MRYFFLSSISSISFLAAGTQAAPPPEVLQKELCQAEKKYAQAKEMFNPWYTGPLVTPSASMMPPGSANIQPYLFFVDTYATFDSTRHSVSLPHNLYSVQLIAPLQVGITDTMDLVFNPGGEVNWQDGETGGGFLDIGCTIGFPILRQSIYIPGLKFTISETFPTGKYQNLSQNGLNLNSTGGGSYQTRFGLTTSKVLWWTYPNPMNVRLFVGYTIPSTVHVENFNTYGGGIGTKGTVRPGNSFTADLGMEVSLTQAWVFACDVVYTAQNRTKFHGSPGHTLDGSTATVGSPSNDNLSLAPALEYNWNENLGIIAGSQFSVYGRNSGNFVNGQFSVVYTW